MLIMKVLTLVVIALFSIANATYYLEEKFNDDSVFDRWLTSTSKEDLGKFIITNGKTNADPKEDKGLKTSEDAKFYGISTTFPKFSNKDKTLHIQFSVKHEQGIDCGGGYIKLFGSDVKPESFHGESPYHIMFGPDICGMSTKKVHVIFGYNGKNYLVKKNIACKDDVLTHLYRLDVLPTNEFVVYIDDKKVESGSLEDDFDILPPKEINDPSQSKPEDWVDEMEMDDPEDKKPADWDVPKTIPDKSAKKPEDWDDELDGEWEPPMIENPDFKGEWSPKRIPNPKYKGEWKHPQIPNPEYKPNKELYAFSDIAGIGFDLWQVKSGTIFDNLVITDKEEDLKKYVDIWKNRLDEETKQKEEEDKKTEEEAKKLAEKETELPEEDKEGEHDEL